VRGGRTISWVLFVGWCAWLIALQGVLGATPSIGFWAPDLGLLLLFALDGRVSPREARRAAILVALTRIAFSTDPPLAILAGYLGAVWFFGALRRIVEVDRPLPRALFAGIVAPVLAAFWILSRRLALSSEAALFPAAEIFWKGALSTALLALLVLPLLARLPGLPRLWDTPWRMER
jgi:hypothetical protein